ncbi:MAG: hypothetical protein RL160_1174 [Bacteroidota bacterium]
MQRVGKPQGRATKQAKTRAGTTFPEEYYCACRSVIEEGVVLNVGKDFKLFARFP